MSDPFYTLQIILTSIFGGIVRYLVEFLVKAQELDKLSWGILVIYAIIGMFAGYMAFLVCSLFTTIELAGILAAGLGSFGSYGTLFWLLEKAKKKLVLVDAKEYKKLKDDSQKTELDV